MNAATKTRIANYLTMGGSAVAVIQTNLMSPPFTVDQIMIWGTILTYLGLLCTYWKQYLSPEVNNTGKQVTLWVALIATVTGVLDLIHILHFNVIWEQRIRWSITVVIMLLNIASKQIFPSNYQKDKIQKLKQTT